MTTDDRKDPDLSPEYVRLHQDPPAPDDWSFDEEMAISFAGRGAQPSSIRDPTARKFYEAYLAAHPGAFQSKPGR
jgi:hypothetical protein